jgi:hypothetical protein
MSLRGLACGAVVGLGLLTASASAFAQDQVWLQDRRYTEGMGYRVGDLELHPGVAGEFGYDSNYFLRAPSEHPEDSLRFRLTPSLSLSTLSQQRRAGDAAGAEPPKVNFRAGASATYNEFIATQSQNSDDMSRQRNVGGMANAQLTILPNRPWGGDIYGNLLRMVQPSNNPDSNYDRLEGRAGVGLTWQPGGGMFDWRLGYEYGITAFEQDAFKQFDNAQNQVNTRGRWRFLPRTALMYDASLGFVRYTNGNALLHDSDPVRARIGLNGLVSPSFALLAMAGWGSSFYQGGNAQQFDSALAQVELKWFITPNPSNDPAAATLALSSLAIGYTRDFFNSYLGDYYTRDRGYLNLTHFFAGRFLIVAEGGVAALEYPTLFFPGGGVRSAPFNDIRIDGTLFGEYRVADSFGINVTGRYTSELSNKKLLVDNAGNVDDLSYKRFEAYLGARWFM